MPRRRRQQFIWPPQNRPTKWSCTIDGTDITNFILDGKFPQGLMGEELVCNILLDDSGGDFTDLFGYDDIILFKMDFADGSTTRFQGFVEKARPKNERGIFGIEIKGAHWTAKLTDITVTKKYEGSTISAIRTDLMTNFAPSGFTSNNVETNDTIVSKLPFNKTPLLNCMATLDRLGEEDSYIDNDKDLHSFPRETKIQDTDVLVIGDGMLELHGLGPDGVDVRNNIIVEGTVGGLPVIYVDPDSDSQAVYGQKDHVIADNSVTSDAQAQEVASTEKAFKKDPPDFGGATCMFMPNLNPGDMTWVVSPPSVHKRTRVVKFEYFVPLEQTEVYFNQERSLPKLFKERFLKELAQEVLTNELAMKRSYVFSFDDETNIDISSSSGYVIEDGFLRKDTSVEKAIIVSNVKETDLTAGSFEVKALGETVDGAAFSGRADNTTDFQSVSANATTETTVDNSGKQITFKIEITNNDTRIETAGLYWKD